MKCVTVYDGRQTYVTMELHNGGIPSPALAQTSIYLPWNRQPTTLGLTLLYHDGIRTISGSTLLDLQTGHLVYSSEQHEVSFMCFLYSPKHGNSATWMVSKTDNNSYIRPIRYNNVHFVKGVQYHNTNTIIASVTGIYYIYNSVMVAPISGSFAVKTYLYINDKCICNYQVYYSSVEMNGLVTFSASFSINLMLVIN